MKPSKAELAFLVDDARRHLEKISQMIDAVNVFVTESYENDDDGGKKTYDGKQIDDGNKQTYDGKQIDDGNKQTYDGKQIDDGDKQTYDGKQIDDGDKQMDPGKQIDDGDKQMDPGKQIDDGDKQTYDGDGKQIDDGDDKQIDRGKQIVIDEGKSPTSCTQSRKRKRNASGSTCPDPKPQRPIKATKRLPRGYGYVLEPPSVDENGVYCPRFTNRVALMICDRCGSVGEHWDPFCQRPIYDPPETEEEAAQNMSWKYILRSFNLTEYLEKQEKLKTQGKVQPSRRKAVKSKPFASIHCPNKIIKLPLPEGYGYVPMGSWVDENGVYQPRFTDRVAYMSCDRCGSFGDHWDPFCQNPIYDPPETEEEAAQNQMSWKYILRNFDLKEYLEKQEKLKTQGQPEPEHRNFRKLVKSEGRLSRSALYRLCYS